VCRFRLRYFRLKIKSLKIALARAEHAIGMWQTMSRETRFLPQDTATLDWLEGFWVLRGLLLEILLEFRKLLMSLCEANRRYLREIWIHHRTYVGRGSRDHWMEIFGRLLTKQVGGKVWALKNLEGATIWDIFRVALSIWDWAPLFQSDHRWRLDLGIRLWERLYLWFVEDGQGVWLKVECWNMLLPDVMLSPR
jgi:hypothetical protein